MLILDKRVAGVHGRTAKPGGPIPGIVWRDDQISPGWLPVDIGGRNNIIRWMNVGSAVLAEPFFRESMRVIGNRVRSAEVETELSALENGTKHLSAVTPAGIIFHMSRCGSTLLTNALRTGVGVVGLSEASPIDNMMNLSACRSGYWRERATALLTPLTTVFAHYQGQEAGKVVIKCGGAGMLRLRSVRAAWPDVPCVILIRSPIEVLVSNLKGPPEWMQKLYDRPDESVLGPAPPEVAAAGPEGLSAWAMGRFCEEALEAFDDGCTVIDYESLTPDVVAEVASSFGLCFSSEGERRFAEAFCVNAKRTELPFESDVAQKREAATESLRSCAERWADDPYRRLREHAAKLVVQSAASPVFAVAG